VDLPRYEGRWRLSRPRHVARPGRDGPRRDRAHDAGGRVAAANRGDARVHDCSCFTGRDAARQRRLARGGAVPLARGRRRLRRDARALALLLRDEPRGAEAAARRYSAGDHEPRPVQSERARAPVLAVPEDARAVDVQSGGCGVLLHRRGQTARPGVGRAFAHRGRLQRNRHGAVHAGGARERVDRRRGAGRVVRRAVRGRKTAVAGGRGVRGGVRGVSGRGAVPVWRRGVTRGSGGAGGRAGNRRVGDVPRTRALRRDAEGVPERGRVGVTESGRRGAADGVGGDGERECYCYESAETDRGYREFCRADC